MEQNVSQDLKTPMPSKPSKFIELDTNAFDRFFSGVDRKMGVNIYNKSASIFLKNIEDRITSLTESLNNFDNQSAIVTAHQIKGSLLSLGGNNLADVFRQIEMNVNLSPNSELLMALHASKGKLDLFVSELKEWMNELEKTV